VSAGAEQIAASFAWYQCARCHKGHVVRLSDSYYREFCDECVEYLSEQWAIAPYIEETQ
jgi:hypothetical protein